MKSALIGYTGFVGQNLMLDYQFTDLYNSKNIQDIKDKKYDLVVCSGVPAQMGLANKFPEKDMANIQLLFEHISSANIKKLILISSTAVYKANAKAHTEITTDEYETEIAYGKNRRKLEELVEMHYPDHIILRLPALFGISLKKNFLFDLINREPAFLNEKKYNELKESMTPIEFKMFSTYYQLNPDNGFYVFNKTSAQETNKRNELKALFKKYNSTSLNFTNPKSNFQFYNVGNLWTDINICINNNIKSLNVCSKAIRASEIAKYFFDLDMKDMAATLFNQDMQTIHAKHWHNGTQEYLYSADYIWSELREFFEANNIEICTKV